MRKVFIFIISISIALNFLAIGNASTVSRINKDCKEIIIKYQNDSELIFDKVRTSVKSKTNFQKFERKKVIHTANSNLDIVEIGENDNINEIIDKLSTEKDVKFAVPNHKITVVKQNIIAPIDPNFNLQWGIQNNAQLVNGIVGKRGVDIDVVKAWQITKGLPSIVVGVLDTGVDINHEDLKNSIFKNTNEIPANGIDDDKNGYIDDISGWNFVNNDYSVYDSYINDSHGTHVTGIIASDSNNVGITGVAPNVKVLPLKFIDGTSGGNVSDAIEAIEYGKSMGVNIFNCSWDMLDYNIALENEIKSTDAVFICAAGNYNGNVTLSPTYPACFDSSNIISVSSIDSSGNLSKISNYGIKIEVAAPGDNIISTFPGNKYTFASGTSMAAPFVSGISSLVLSQNNSLKPEEVVNKIINSVNKLSSLKSVVSSGGIVNALKSVQ